jgi:hypothetical protein
MNLRRKVDILVRVGRANDLCTFMISNRSAVFEVASAENSGTTDSEVSDAGRSIPSYPVYFPSIFGQCRVAEVEGSFRLV